MIFIDTNYFLRFLLHDIESEHLVAKTLFEKGAKGEAELFTSLIVFFEIYWVLLSFYKKEKLELLKTLKDILKLNFIEFAERPLLEQSLNLLESFNFDLEDVYNVVYAHKNKAQEFASFDEKLKKKFSTCEV